LLLVTAFAAFLASATVRADGKCGGNTCDEFSPCCNGSYCSSGALYCMPGLCDPSKSYKPDSCWKVAHCIDQKVDFSSKNAFAPIADYEGDPSKTAFVSQWTPNHASIQNGKLSLTLEKDGDSSLGATVLNTRQIQYGQVSAVVQSGCASPGVVSSVIIRNDKIGDEIDFEFVGGDISTVQSNYYWHNQLDYTKMIKSPHIGDTTQELHTYQINWTPDEITWAVDGKPFRTVKRSDTWDDSAKAYKYPDSEATVSFSIWDAGAGGAQGTIDWAGGLVDWSKGPFNMQVKSIDISCYYKGNDTTYTPPNSDDNSEEDESSDNSDSSEEESSDSSNSEEDSSDSDGGVSNTKTGTSSNGKSNGGSSKDAASDDDVESGADSSFNSPLILASLVSAFAVVAGSAVTRF
ncbi:putative glycosidase CRH2, partial [Spiromyces aspiralis]